MIRPSGPKGLPVVGVVPYFAKDPCGYMMKAAKTHGKICFFDMKAFPLYMVTDPDMIAHVLFANRKNYLKSQFYEKLIDVVGLGLLTAEQQQWRKQRRIAQPSFQPGRIQKMADTMSEEALRMATELRRQVGGTVELSEYFMQTTQKIIIRTMFGDMKGLPLDSLGEDWSYINIMVGKRFWNILPILEKIPTPTNLKYKRSKKRLYHLVRTIMELQRKEGVEQDNFLSMLMRAKDAESNAVLTDQELQDNVVTMLLAGHETTSVALSWTLHLLSKHPDVQERAAAECRAVATGDRITMEQLSQLPYTRAILDESLRLYPPAWVFSRQAIEEDEIGGYKIPVGGAVMMSPYVMQRHPEFWENPDQFNPERFLKTRPEALPKFHYFPFGGGERGCIGNHFALMEAVIILAMILREFKFEDAGVAVKMTPHITLQPDPGVYCKVTAR